MMDFDSWTPDRGLVQELEDQSARAVETYRIQPNLITEHANLEESIRTGGYANRTILELLQNAADAVVGADKDGTHTGRVEITLDADNGILYCANAGRPFSRDGLTAIAMAYMSAKRGEEIGRFGLGFKSVLAVSDAPQVFSRSVSFEFNTPAAQTLLRNANSAAERLPVLRTATAADFAGTIAKDSVLAEMAEWATTIVRLPGARNLEQLRADITGFQAEFMLFVRDVRQVHMRIIGGEKPYTAVYKSQDLGGGRHTLTTAGGQSTEWFVRSKMHTPSLAARHEVGEAVSRSKIKVTIASPVNQKDQRRGQFWSYFPLQDATSASALFNAPWSVNDDRTTMQSNTYNREILDTMTGMFVDLLPAFASPEDPARHLDFMPARGREALSFADRVLTRSIPRLAAEQEFIPDAVGENTYATNLIPLDFAAGLDIDMSIHIAWTQSPHTGDNVPHPSCYATRTRAARLRTLYALAQNSERGIEDEGDLLAAAPKRGLLSWLREWAEGDDMGSAANALKLVDGGKFFKEQLVSSAKVIPTGDGLKSLEDRRTVFLHPIPGVEFDDATFINPDFLRIDGVERILRARGFGDMDARAILSARMVRLSHDPSPDEMRQVWDSVDDVPPADARKTMLAAAAKIKVPTLDGGWEWPQQVLDLEANLGTGLEPRMLDRKRCTYQIAHALGVVTAPVRDYFLEDEFCLSRYTDWVLATLNEGRGPGERPVQDIEFNHADGSGPFSLLFLLQESEADEARERWTAELLKFPDKEWICTDTETGRTYAIVSPVRWAIREAGLVRSSMGVRCPVDDVVAPSLLLYDGLLPLFRGSSQATDFLQLPDELENIPPRILRASLESPVFRRGIKPATLRGFVLEATRTAFPDHRPSTIPAHVGNAIEATAPHAVYVATTAEQREFLHERHRPHLCASEEQANELYRLVGCRSFEDSFSFSEIITGPQEPELILDVYPGLRNRLGTDALEGRRVTRATEISKHVNTDQGAEVHPMDWHQDGGDLVIRRDADEIQALRFINEVYTLGLNNYELQDVIRKGLDHRLEELRLQAQAEESDADRLDIYIGPDDMKDALPTGLWSALEVQELIDDSSSVAELFLLVYGSDALWKLADNFRREGFPDVPQSWGGSSAAISWVRKMGFPTKYAGQRTVSQNAEFVVPGAVKLDDLHPFQKVISEKLREALTRTASNGDHQKCMVELPTGAGKTRVATQTVLRLFTDEVLYGNVLWIAQSEELCEQAVQTFETVWRYLGDIRPLTIGRLWTTNTVHEPDTEFGIIVATDAKIESVMDRPEYEWLRSASAVFVDEAHRAGGSTRYTQILRWLGVDGRSFERPLVGLSATPFKGRSDDAERTKQLAARFGHNRLTAFEEDAYRKLVGLEVLARVKHEVLPGVDIVLDRTIEREIRESRVINRGLYENLGKDEARMKILVEHIMELTQEHPDWPVLVFTPSVLSAQVLSASLRYRGVESESVSGQTGRQQRRDVLQKFRRGGIQVLANCDLLIQGFDAPGVRALYIARPTFSPSAYIQMAGRGLRGPKNGGKEECLIVDVADNWGAMNDFLGYRDYTELWDRQGQKAPAGEVAAL